MRIEEAQPLPGEYDPFILAWTCRWFMKGVKISDHRQCMATTPSKGLPHTPNSAGGRWF